MRLALLPSALAFYAAAAACSSFSVADEPGGASVDAGSGDATTGTGPDAGPSPEVVIGQRPTPVVTGRDGPGSGIAYFAGSIYVSEAEHGVIYTAPGSGGAPMPFADTGGAPKNPVATSDGLYWCDTKDLEGGPLGAYVVYRSYGGGTHRSIALNETCLGLAVLGSGVAILYGGGDTGGGFLDYATTGLEQRRMVGPVAVDGNPYAIAARDGLVYVTRSASGAVRSYQGLDQRDRLPVLGEVVSAGESDCQQIAVSGTTLFWSRPSDQLVTARSIFTSGETSVVPGEAEARSLVADETHLYWVDAAGRIRRTRQPLEQAADTIATGAALASSGYYRTIALSDTRVFWLTANGVASVPKATK